MDTAVARKRLENTRDDLDRSIAVLRGEPGDNGASDYPRDPADAGTSLSDADRTEAILDAAKRQRTEVLAALTRLEHGVYGTCVDCGTPVPEGRLEARPEAARCVACQSKNDKSRR